jgi:hypothetical protein
MRDWFLNLSIPWMAFIIFAATYVVAACVYLAVVRLAVGDRASAFKALSPAMLPPLGTIFGLLSVMWVSCALCGSCAAVISPTTRHCFRLPPVHSRARLSSECV